jgi:pyridoxamine 5'-phosphate oxidase
MNPEVVRQLRREYEDAGLDVGDLAPDPMTQFRVWFTGAVESGIDEPNAFVLATVSSDKVPSARAVLMKELRDESFGFFTNLESDKSRDIASNSQVAATFLWLPLHRQVRFRGLAERISDEKADEYFATRPRGAQIAAHSSYQSRPVSGREQLEEEFDNNDARFGEVVPRPSNWGGWEITPDSVEFWQGRPDRFHDRLRYTRAGRGWNVERLQP